MIRIAPFAATVLAASVLASHAADLPNKAAEPEWEEPPPIPVFSWTGAYAGVHGGGEFGRDAFRVATPSAASFGSSPSGIIGGAHAGYNHAVPQVAGGRDIVLGLEGDVDGADERRAAFALGRVFVTQTDLKGSVRGRVGIAASRVLVFATGGLALADAASQERLQGLASPDLRATRMPIGYTLGAGVEYAFTNSYALRAEYRASALRGVSTPRDAAAPAAAVSRRETDNRLQAGISYRFGPSTPAEPASTP